MSNILINMDILSKHVHLYSWKMVSYQKQTKVETWNKPFKIYNAGNQVNEKQIASHPDHQQINAVVNQYITTAFFNIVEKVVENLFW